MRYPGNSSSDVFSPFKTFSSSTSYSCSSGYIAAFRPHSCSDSANPSSYSFASNLFTPYILFSSPSPSPCMCSTGYSSAPCIQSSASTSSVSSAPPLLCKSPECSSSSCSVPLVPPPFSSQFSTFIPCFSSSSVSCCFSTPLNSFFSHSGDSTASLSYQTRVGVSCPSTKPLVNSCSSHGMMDTEVDQLTEQLENVCSLTYDHYNKLIIYMKSNDVDRRMEATRAFAQSLAFKFALPKNHGVCNSPSKPPPLGSSCNNSFAVTSSQPSADSGNSGAVWDVTIGEVITAGIINDIDNSLQIGPANYWLQVESVRLLRVITERGGNEGVRRVGENRGLISRLVSLLAVWLGLDGLELREEIFAVLTNVSRESSLMRDTVICTPGAPWAIACACGSDMECGAMRLSGRGMNVESDISNEGGLLSINSQIGHGGNISSGGSGSGQVAAGLAGAKLCQALLMHSPLPYSVDVTPLVDFLADCLRRSVDPDVLCAACGACMAMCETSQGAAWVVAVGALPLVVDLLGSDNANVLYEALAVVAKIAYAGTTEQINDLIECGAVSRMVALLETQRPVPPCTLARACNALGNIGCETPKQVQTLIDRGAFSLLVGLFRNESDYNTRIEAAYAVCAAASRANQQQVAYIVSCTASHCRSLPAGDCNCMQLIADMLELVKASDPTNPGSLKLCKAILRGLENILSVGDDEARAQALTENPYAHLFRQVHGVIILSQMQFFPEYTISTRTRTILGKYFTADSVCCSIRD